MDTASTFAYQTTTTSRVELLPDDYVEQPGPSFSGAAPLTNEAVSLGHIEREARAALEAAMSANHQLGEAAQPNQLPNEGEPSTSTTSRPAFYSERSEVSATMPLLDEPSGEAFPQTAEAGPSAAPELSQEDMMRAIGLAINYGGSAEAGPSGTQGDRGPTTGDSGAAGFDEGDGRVRLPPRVKVDVALSSHGIPLNPIMTFLESLSSASHLLEVQKILDRSKTPKSYHRVDTRARDAEVVGEPEDVAVLAVLAAQHALQEAQAGEAGASAQDDLDNVTPIVRELRIDIATLHQSALFRLEQFRRKTLRLPELGVTFLEYLQHKSLDPAVVQEARDKAFAEAEAIEQARAAEEAKRKEQRKPKKKGRQSKARADKGAGADQGEQEQQDEQDELANEEEEDAEADVVIVDDEAEQPKKATRSRKSVPSQPAERKPSTRTRRGTMDPPALESPRRQSARGQPAAAASSPNSSGGVQTRHAAAAAAPPSNRTRKRGAASPPVEALPPRRRRRTSASPPAPTGDVNTAWLMQPDGSAMSKPAPRKRLIGIMVDAPKAGKSSSHKASIDLDAQPNGKGKVTNQADKAQDDDVDMEGEELNLANGSQAPAGPSKRKAPATAGAAAASTKTTSTPSRKPASRPRPSGSPAPPFSEVESEDGYHHVDRDESIDELAPSEDELLLSHQDKSARKGKKGAVPQRRGSDASWSEIWGFLA